MEINNSDFKNSTEKELISKQDSPILNIPHNNTNLTTNMLTLGGLRFYLNFKFNSLRLAGNKAGLSYGRMRQLVTGKYLPSTAEHIKHLAESWDIDSIKLTQLFERMRDKK